MIFKVFILFLNLFISILISVVICAHSSSNNNSDILVINAGNESEIETSDEDVDDSENYSLPIKYDGAQLWRIPFDNQEMRNAVTELQNNYDVSMWNTNGSYVDLFLKEISVSGAGQLLKDANVPYSVLIENMQYEIENENPSKEEIEKLQNRQGHRMTWGAYHPISDIYGYLDYLAKTYDDICSVKSIGKTFEGLPIKVLRISNGNPNNRAIWIDGGIHAREWISPAAVTYIINYFTEEWEDQPDFIRNIDWYILPVANPDGYEYSQKFDRLWRKNRGGKGRGRCAGADLNRNFGHKWGVKGASNNPCSEIFAGTKPFSEPETQAQRDFFAESAADFKAFLTFHSYGQYILYPWGYDKVLPADHAELLAVGNAAAKQMSRHTQSKYKVGSSAILLYPAAGASDDWAKGDLGIKYTYTVELRDTGRYGFILPASQIEKTSLEALDFVKVVAEKVYSN